MTDPFCLFTFILFPFFPFSAFAFLFLEEGCGKTLFGGRLLTVAAPSGHLSHEAAREKALQGTALRLSSIFASRIEKEELSLPFSLFPFLGGVSWFGVVLMSAEGGVYAPQKEIRHPLSKSNDFCGSTYKYFLSRPLNIPVSREIMKFSLRFVCV